MGNPEQVDPAGTPASGIGQFPIAAVAAGTVTLIVLEIIASLPASRYVIAGIHAAMLAAALIAAAPALRREPTRSLRILAAGFTLSVFLVIAAAATAGSAPMDTLAQGLMPTLAGWSAWFVTWRVVQATEPGAGVPNQRAPPRPDWRPSHLHAAAFLVLLAVALAIVRALAVGQWAHAMDEPDYYVQSGWIGLTQVSQPVDPALADFFRTRKFEYSDGHLFGMYPPGWPVLLALFRAAGLGWWSGVLLGVASVILIYLIGRRLGTARFATTAAVLLGSSQYFLMLHAGYMSHASTVAAALAAVLCFLTAEQASGWRQRLLWCAAGALVGFHVTVRPLSGLAIGGAIGLWMLHRMWRLDPGRVMALAGWVLVGGTPIAALLLWHNQAVYGEMLTVGYTRMSGGVYDLGFGERGVTSLDANQVRNPATFEFTPRLATSWLFRRLAGVNITFVPIGLLFPLVSLAVMRGFRIPWVRVAPFALLPLAYWFYWYEGLRLYSELLPFVVLGAAAMVTHLVATHRRLGAAWFGLLVSASIVMCFNWPQRTANDWRRWTDYGYAGDHPVPLSTLERADSLRRVHGEIVLFVRDDSGFDNLIGALYYFNHEGLDGPVLVARDLGARNRELLDRHPGRAAFRVTDRGRTEAARFAPLPVP